jgi:propionyl-CoA carboxylase alpha chain
MFSKILIANRGEIAVRIIRTCRRLGIETVVVCSEADEDSLAADMADQSIVIGPPPAAQSYLLGDRIIAAARETGADAVHPGFGFLSENAGFARACQDAGLVFIGPNPDAIDKMGDKIQSKRFAAQAGVSIVPGHVGEVRDTQHAISIASEIGYPVMIKASAGGGGKGIRVAWNPDDISEGFPAVQAEARGAFGDDRIFIEKFIENPRHIEIQVLGDKQGNLVHLFERECSIQRRNQKVIEEAPSPLLDSATREAMGSQAVALARAVSYDSAGTVEFVAGQDRSFYFLEMNTRLQVEHPVTELITGIDLVEQMIRVAAGEPLAFSQADLAITGWAIEGRIYAEDPYRNFLPSIGRLVRYRPPEEGDQSGWRVRNDTGVREGDEISVFYDPMIAKLCSWAAERDTALNGMGRALEDMEIEGVGHNAPFLSAVIDQERFRSGNLSTRYIEDEFPGGFHGVQTTAWQSDLMAATAAFMHITMTARARAVVGGQNDRSEWVVVADESHRPVLLTAREDDLEVTFAEDGRSVVLDKVSWRPGHSQFRGRLEGQDFTAEVRAAPEGFDIRHRASRARVLVLTPRSAELHQRLPAKAPADTSRLVLSPMPGLVIAAEVAAGEQVREGQVLFIVEAMKMQNIIRAERDGMLRSVPIRAGDSVAADDVMAEFA